MNNGSIKKQIDVLLIEDSESDVLLTREAFRNKQSVHQIYAVSDGFEAMDFLYQKGDFKNAPRPDIILLDLNLPRKVGREVLDEIKRDPELKRIPVIVLTTSSADEDILYCYDLHANCYLKKPVNMNEFYEIADLIEQFWCKIASLPGR